MKVIDLHCDTILHLTDDSSLCLAQNPLSVDMEKLIAGNSLAQFFALYIDLEEHPAALERALTMADVFYRELEANSGQLALASSYQELCANEQAGKISAFLTIEEGGALQGSLANLRNFYRLGVRLITLTWNYPNELGYPGCMPQWQQCGLTEFGRQTVEEMNRLGMIVDVSHLSDRGFYDVAELSRRPFVASHSNARAVTPHNRNLTDDMLRILAHKGGVAGLNFSGSFLGGAPFSRIEDMVRHVKHMYQVGGSDVIALGSDFDGIEYTLEVEHSGQLNKLFAALTKEGFTTDELEKFAYKNTLRVIKECL